MKPLILILFLTNSLFFSARSQSSTDSTYQHFWQLQTGYTGGQATHLLALDYAYVKVCKSCDNTHRKIFGFGMETGFNEYQEWIYGPKIFYQREAGRMGFRFGFHAYHWPQNNFYHFVIRPELLFFPLKKQRLSLSAAFNLQKNITPSIIPGMLNIVVAGVRYYW